MEDSATIKSFSRYVQRVNCADIINNDNVCLFIIEN